jgi:hypothetical protein
VYAYKLILECLDLGFTVLSKRRIGLLLNDVTHRRKFIAIKSHFEAYIYHRIKEKEDERKRNRRNRKKVSTFLKLHSLEKLEYRSST